MQGEVSKACARAVVRYEAVTEQMKLDNSRAQLEQQKSAGLLKQIEKNERYKELYLDLQQQVQCEAQLT